MNRMPRVLVAVLAAAVVTVGALPTPGRAQDTHYWNSQYGPRAMLLGGTIVGGVKDMSATYYNPGALGYIEEPELLLSANVYQKTVLRVEDGAGTGEDLVSGDFRPLPNMIAGAFRWAWLGENKLAYSVITRYRFDVELGATVVDRFHVIDDYPGEEDFAGARTFSADVKETWAGLSWAPTVNRRVGFGVTPYFTIRSQSNDDRIFAQALSDAGEIALLQVTDSYEMSHYGLLLKAGIGVDLRPLTLGLTVTTPKLRLGGSGTAITNATHVQLDLDGDGTRTNGFESDVQADVTANNESPLSVAGGASYRIGQTAVHASAEWFDSVDPYAVLELTSFRSQTTGEDVERTLVDAAESVVNWGVGIEHRFTERTQGYVSLVTDHSSSSELSDVAVTGFDIQHLAGGAAFQVRRSEFTVGLAYAWGDEQVDQRIDLDPGDGGSVLDPNEKRTLRYQRISFVFGFSVAL